MMVCGHPRITTLGGVAPVSCVEVVLIASMRSAPKEQIERRWCLMI